MNKILKYTKEILKAFLPFVIYYFISIFFSAAINSMDSLNKTTYEVLLICSEIVIFLVLIFFSRKKIKKDFKDFDNNYKKYLSIGIKAWFLGYVVMILSNYFITNFVTSTVANNEAVNELVLFKFPLYSVISMIILGPTIEELAFRLGFKENISNKKVYYILTVLLFASLHVLNGISSPVELLYYIPYGAMAVSFAYMLDKTDNIFTSAIIHTLHNAFTIVIIILSSMMGV